MNHFVDGRAYGVRAAYVPKLEVVQAEDCTNRNSLRSAIVTRTFCAAGHDHGDGSAEVRCDEQFRTENLLVGSEGRFVCASVGPEVYGRRVRNERLCLRFRYGRVLPD